MDLLWLVIIGAIIGFLGRLVAGRDVNLFATVVVGIVGTWLGFYFAGMTGGGALMAYLVGIVLAAILVSIVGGVSRRRYVSR